MRIHNVAKQYRRAVRRCLLCVAPLRQQILDALQSDLAEFMTTHPTATLAQVEQHFGTPAEFAKAAICEMDRDDLIQIIIQNQKDVRYMIVMASLVLFLTLSIAVFWIANALPIDLLCICR